MSIPQALSARASLLRRWPVVTSLVSVAAIMAIAIGVVVDARQQVEIRTRETSWNLLRAIQRDVSRNVEILDLSLGAVIEGLARPEVMALPPELRNQVLFDRSATASGVGALIVFDADGNLRIDSTSIVPHSVLPVTDREHFQVQQRDANAGLFISRPYLSRVVGKEVVALSRRVPNPDGSFGGTVLASIQVEYFQELFTSLHLEPGAILSLLRDDGAVLLRMERKSFRTTGNLASSPVFQAIRKQGSGDYVGVSIVDDVERLYSFTRVGSLPLILSIGIPTASVYGDWALKSTLVLVALALISSVLVGLCVLVSRELARRAEAETKLVAANAELERLSTTDALTGLGNRRSYDHALARESRRAARTHRPLSLILLDVDHFKQFNDHYGHPQGDSALRSVAEILRESARRPGDSAYRIGGEEFAILLADTDTAGAVGVMEAVRRDLFTRALPHATAPRGRLTVSQGATEIFAEEVAAAVDRADNALYRAKHDGRDRAYVEAIRVAA